ncbi:MAG: endolytic transglycosylase MltG [Magnetococcus sp. DMHC-6]
MQHRTIRRSIFLFVFGWLFCGLFVVWFQGITRHVLPVSVEITIETGWGVRRVAQELEERGAIPSSWAFLLLTRFGQGFIQAGEYRFAAGATPVAILNQLRRGEVIRRPLLIPEGFSVADVQEVLQEKGWKQAPIFLKDSKTPALFGLDTNVLEGFIFPSTYFYQRDEPLTKLIGRMVAQSKTVLQAEYLGRAPGVTLTPYQGLILASIIEKETAVAEERDRISGVFYNRLAKKMRLQTDPTVIYGIEHFNGNLTRKNLTTLTPYNTYMIEGLPPTPICNPGRAAIHAAFHPLNTQEFYFVSRGDGHHIFSKTLAEHEHNVDIYQRHRQP